MFVGVTMVRVCDAIMGSGKSSAAFSYINKHCDKKFIYITPYLAEASRVRCACPNAHFIEPSANIAEYDFKKSQHTAALIKDGRNIATTHQAFIRYTDDMLEDIRRYKYTLIIDENVEVVHKFAIGGDDLRIAIASGLVSENDGICKLADDSYSGTFYADLVSQLRSRDLMRVKDSEVSDMFYWEIPPDLFKSFSDVIVLTYMFEGQSLFHFFTMYGIEYDYIGVTKDAGGEYTFCEGAGSMPFYVSNINNMIHVLESDAMNGVGSGQTALSVAWFKRGGSSVDRLRKNVYNYFHNVSSNYGSGRMLWSTYNQYYDTMKGKGYTRCFLSFNTRATNQYAGRDCLAYLVNLYMPVGEKLLYQRNGAQVDDDKYALSVMVQWIWRSAIRNGKPINIYIPSRRMRDLLIDWSASLAEGGAAR